jgi:signal transduction histidine kinase
MRKLSQNVECITPASDEELRRYLVSDEELDLFKTLGCRSFIVVPLAARNTIYANITFVSGRREFDEQDLLVATEIARILGLSADNAKLYGEAQKAVRIRDEILGIVAHDLKNPLAAIRLTSQVFQRRFPPTEDAPVPAAQVNHMLQSIDRSVERAIRLITDLLDFSKMTSGKMQINPQAVSADHLLMDAMEYLNPLASERSLALEWRNESRGRKVQCEPERIQQVLSNLIGNAIKFTPPNGKIVITAKLVGPDLAFSVSDNGPGIPEEDISHLFERFWQAAKTKELGSGLGLPICKGIVDAHRGRIWVTSQLGEGSTFHFTLPLADLLC